MLRDRDFDWRGCESDRREAEKFLECVASELQERGAYIRMLKLRARNLIHDEKVKPLVRAVAHALLKKRRLGYRAVRDVMRNDARSRLNLRTDIPRQTVE